MRQHRWCRRGKTFSWGLASTAWNRCQAPNRDVALAFNSANNTVHEGLSAFHGWAASLRKATCLRPQGNRQHRGCRGRYANSPRGKVGVRKEPAIGKISRNSQISRRLQRCDRPAAGRGSEEVPRRYHPARRSRSRCGLSLCRPDQRRVAQRAAGVVEYGKEVADLDGAEIDGTSPPCCSRC